MLRSSASLLGSATPIRPTASGLQPPLARRPASRRFREVFSGYELHYYLAIRAGRLGFHVTEVPVSRVYPDHGPVPTKISPIRGNLRVLRGLYRACRGDYDPQSP